MTIAAAIAQIREALNATGSWLASMVGQTVSEADVGMIVPEIERAASLIDFLEAEIERLTRERDETATRWWLAVNKNPEVERLTKELGEAKTKLEVVWELADHREAEVERLREAGEGFVDWLYENGQLHFAEAQVARWREVAGEQPTIHPDAAAEGCVEC